MSLARDYAPLPAWLLDADYGLDFAFYGASESEPLDWPEGSTFSLHLAPAGRAQPAAELVHELTTEDGDLVVSGHVVGIVSTVESHAAWAPGLHEVQLRRTGPDAVTEALYFGQVWLARGLSQLAALGGGNSAGVAGGQGVKLFRDGGPVRVLRGESVASVALASAAALAAAADRQQTGQDRGAVAEDRQAVTQAATAVAEALPLAVLAKEGAEAARDAIVTVISNEDVPGATLIVEDPGGYAVFIQYDDGSTWSPELAQMKVDLAAAEPAAQSVGIEAWGNVPFAFTDASGFAIGYVDPSGRIRSPAMDADRAELSAVRARVDALDHVDDPGVEMRGGLNYIPVYGQSLSIGVEGGPAISTTPIAWAKRFTSGTRPHEAITGGETDPAVLYGAIEGLVESTVETICSGAAEVYGALYAARFGATPDQHDQQLLFCCPGEGGQPIDSLDEGTAYFTRLAETVEYGAARAAALDAAYAVPAAMYLQGATDQGNATHPDFYRFLFRGLRDSIAQLAALHADQDRAPPILHYQIGQHLMFGSLEPTIALAQLAMAEEAGFALVCPLYPFPFAPDGVHMINTSYRWMGGYFGRALFEWAYDQVKPRRLKPLWAEPQADGVLLAFDVPKPPIVFDTTLVTDPGDYGFEILDAAGDALTIDVVSRAGPSHVFIRPTSGEIATVRYACRNGLALNTHTGPTSGPRGNLRDCSGEALTLLVSGVAKPLHHWAPIFQLQVS